MLMLCQDITAQYGCDVQTSFEVLLFKSSGGLHVCMLSWPICHQDLCLKSMRPVVPLEVLSTLTVLPTSRRHRAPQRPCAGASAERDGAQAAERGAASRNR